MDTKRRSYDIYDLEERIHALELNGGGGGGGGSEKVYETTSLFHSETLQTTGFDLTGKIDDYDMINIIVGTTLSKSRASFMIDAKYFCDNFKYTASSDNPNMLMFPWANTGISICLGVNNVTNKLSVVGQATNAGILDIIGIKTCTTPTTVSSVTTKTTRSKKK